MRDVKSRLIGGALLLISAVATVGYGPMHDLTGSGAAHPADFAVGLFVFLLASTGILMVIHGDKLFAGKLDGLEPRDD